MLIGIQEAGWKEPNLLQFEQHLYLRQPGYGTCYITGKYLIEKMIAEYAHKLELDGRTFDLKIFMDKFNKAGNIPVELVRWDLIGDKPEFLK